MITKINYTKSIDVYEAVSRIKDYYKDFFFTQDTHRIYLDDLKVIDKILDTQEVYVLEEKQIEGILIIYRSKGFRPYVKILASNYDTQRDMLKYLIWNFSEVDLFFKLKKENPLVKLVQKYGFVFIGNRGTFDKPGTEYLLYRKGEKKTIKLGDNHARINKLRDLIQDDFQYFPDVQQYMGLSLTFNLVQSNIDATSLLVYKNGNLLASPNYTYTSLNGKISIHPISGVSVVSGDVFEFDYNYYAKYSDNEMKAYIRSAINYLITEKYETFKIGTDNVIFPTPTEPEEALIALVAFILTEGSVESYKSPEITINFAKDLSKERKINIAIRQFKKTYGITRFIKLNRDVVIPKEDI